MQLQINAFYLDSFIIWIQTMRHLCNVAKA